MKKKCQSVEKCLIFFFPPRQCMCETNADFSQSPQSDFTSHCFQCLNSVSCNLTQSQKVKNSRAIFTLHVFDSKQQTLQNKSNSFAERELQLLGSCQPSHTLPLVFQLVAKPLLSPFIPTSLICSLPFFSAADKTLCEQRAWSSQRNTSHEKLLFLGQLAGLQPWNADTAFEI